MAFRLTKAQRRELGGHRAALLADRKAVMAAFETMLGVMSDAVHHVNKLIAEHNGRVLAAQAFVDDVAEEFRDAYDERSERWQDSDAGQSAFQFVEEWASTALDALPEVVVLAPDIPAFNESLNLPEESE